MRRYVCLLVVVPFLFSIGCTMPSQKVAAFSAKKAMVQNNDIVSKLRKQAVYGLMMEHYHNLVALMQQPEGEARDKALKLAVGDYTNAVDKLLWVAYREWERSTAFALEAYGYILEQRGVADLLSEDWQDAADRVDSVEDELDGDPEEPGETPGETPGES